MKSTRPTPCLRSAAIGAVLLPLALGASACDDDPFQVRWVANPDTVVLHSLARPELNLASAFNFIGRRPVQIESPGATGSWDMAVDTEGDRLVLIPPGALGIQSQARISRIPGVSFEEVREAPTDSARYSILDPVPVEMGSVYVVRTRQEVGRFGRLCFFYAKLEPLRIEVETGALTFVFDASPACNNPSLVPPDS